MHIFIIVILLLVLCPEDSLNVTKVLTLETPIINVKWNYPHRKPYYNKKYKLLSNSVFLYVFLSLGYEVLLQNYILEQ